MKYLIVGASSGLGRDIATALAKRNNELVIISRDIKDLEALKKDLNIRYKVDIKCFQVDLTNLNQVEIFFEREAKLIRLLDGMLLPIGMMIKDDNFINKDLRSNDIINANLSLVTYFINKMYPIFKEKNYGTIVGFGSVSGLLGREINSSYAAAKRGLDSIFESLAITSLTNKINIQYYILGYLNTNLSEGKKLVLPKGSTEILAEKVINNLDKKHIKIYYPFWWRLISLIILLTSFFIIKFFSKLKKKHINDK